MMETILLGAAGSLLAVFVLALAHRTQVVAALLGTQYGLAQKLKEGGISRLHLSRDDYGRTLRTYLSQAANSIDVVSVSLKVTHDEGDLIGLFRTRLAENPTFRVRVSLLAPSSPASTCAAAGLDLAEPQLDQEIRAMLGALIAARASLPDDQRNRFQVSVHECLPVGSALLLDATPSSGRIQVETKLYRAPRVESFSFEITAPSDFYLRNYRAWSRVLDESRTPRQEECS